jgi:hypothetical protein
MYELIHPELLIFVEKKAITYIENDATGCYDRIINPLVLLFLRKKGVPIITLLS